MSYVYRYLSLQGTPMYIGKVSGDDLTCIARRIAQHKNDFGGKDKNWTVQYVDGLTPADADALETVLIAREKPRFNKSKTQWGDTSFFQFPEPEWKLFDDSPKQKNAKRPSWRTLYPTGTQTMFTCYHCGRKVHNSPPNMVHVDMDGSGITWCTTAVLCDLCQPEISAQLDAFWSNVEKARRAERDSIEAIQL